MVVCFFLWLQQPCTPWWRGKAASSRKMSSSSWELWLWRAGFQAAEMLVVTVRAPTALCKVFTMLLHIMFVILNKTFWWASLYIYCPLPIKTNLWLDSLLTFRSSFQCKRAENFKKHMQLLFQNNVPMCIEVILCCDCPCGVQRAQSAEVGYAPSASDLLLEQWTITYNSRYSS